MELLRKIGVLTPLAVLVVIVAVVNVLLSLGNESLRIAVNERQQIISQSLQLEALNREILTTLAAVALKTNDEQLKSLLAAQGISVSGQSGTAGSTR